MLVYAYLWLSISGIPERNQASKETTQPNPDPKLSIHAVKVGPHKIDPHQFKNIFYAAKNFHIIIGRIYIESIRTGHKVPFQSPE